MKTKKILYLDYAATTPLWPDVVTAMRPYWSTIFGNPHSVHAEGKRALRAVDQSRSIVADFFGVTPLEVTFTSGATESNNLALRGVVKAQSHYFSKIHILISAIEHASILETADDLRRYASVDVTVLPVNRAGHVDPEAVRKNLCEETVLVSVMAANNEIGTIQSIDQIGKIIAKENERRMDLLRRAKKPLAKNYHPIVFHTDAVQVLPWLDIKSLTRHAHLITFSSHKIGGPKGVGGLIVKKNTPIHSVQTGGDQEYARRAGTLNVPGIVGCAKAFSHCQPHKNFAHIVHLRDQFEKMILQKIPGTKIHGAEPRLPHISNIHFRGISNQVFLIKADLDEHLCVSAGSACSAGSVEASHVLTALGVSSQEASESIRFSLGPTTTKKDILDAVRRVKNIVASLLQRRKS